MPAGRARSARDAAAAAGFEVRLLQDYCRTVERSGLVIGVGSTTDAELERALEALVAGCAAV
jgi:GntR family transcriptional regulator/MocR family aminotransferase